MAGLRPGDPRLSCFLLQQREDVDARHKAGHDERRRPTKWELRKSRIQFSNSSSVIASEAKQSILAALKKEWISSLRSQ
jgi:hypothetical protein